VDGAGILVVRESAIGFGAFTFWNFQFVPKIYCGDAEEFVIRFDAPFHVRFQMICCVDSARFQRAGKCAGQSTGERRDDVVDCGRQRCGVFHAVIFGISAMRAELQWLRESLDVRFAKRPLFLYQANSRRMNHFAHKHLPVF